MKIAKGVPQPFQNYQQNFDKIIIIKGHSILLVFINIRKIPNMTCNLKRKGEDNEVMSQNPNADRLWLTLERTAYRARTLLHIIGDARRQHCHHRHRRARILCWVDCALHRICTERNMSASPFHSGAVSITPVCHENGNSDPQINSSNRQERPSCLPAPAKPQLQSQSSPAYKRH